MLLQKIKLGLISGITITILFMVISYVTSTQNSIPGLIIKSLIAGTIGGMLTPFSIQKLFKNTLGIESQPHFKWDEDEQIIHNSEAIYLITQEKIDGELSFTNKRLVFLSNALDTQVITPLENIKKTDTFNPMGTSTEGLEITTITNEHFRFIVDDASLWQSIIGKASS